MLYRRGQREATLWPLTFTVKAGDFCTGEIIPEESEQLSVVFVESDHVA